LRCDDAQTAKLINLGGGRANASQAASWRVKESDAQFALCSANTVSRFLDGLILDRRGPRETPAPNPWLRSLQDRSKNKQKKPDGNGEGGAGATESRPTHTTQLSAKKFGSDTTNRTGSSKPNKSNTVKPEQLDNNVVLKQLRIALSLRSDDLHATLKAGGSSMSPSEAGALFRKPDARNYRQCGDQVLRQFIAGLVEQRQHQDKEQE